MEVNHGGTFSACENTNPAPSFRTSYGLNSALFRRSPPEAEPAGIGGGLCTDRHHGAINGLFLDWSVRRIGLNELWTLRWDVEFNTVGPWTRAGGVQPEDWPR